MSAPPARPAADAVHEPRLGGLDARLVLDAMLELAVLHEIVLGPDGRAVDYRFVDCNPAFTRVTGIARERAVGRLASEVYGTAPPFLDVYARVAQSGEPQRFEAHFAPLDREFAISAVCPRRGWFVTVATDVTDQRRAKDALVHSQGELETIVENVADGVIVAAADGRLLHWNRAALELFGLSTLGGPSTYAEFTRFYPLCTTEGDPVPDRQRPLARILRGEHLRNLHVAIRREGELRTFCYSGRLVPQERGQPSMAVLTVRDVTEELEAHTRLAAERERLAVTLRSIGDAVVVTDADGRITLVNERAERLTGWSADEALYRPLGEVFRIVSEEDGEPVGDPVQRALAAGALSSIPSQALLVARDGSERAIAEHGAPIRDTDGDVTGAVLVFRDQTEERKAAAERERFRAQLAQAQKLESVARLAGGIAHDFNNLLTVVLSCVEALRADLRRGAPASEEDVEEIAAAGARARDLTRQLLAFARKQVIAPMTLDLNEVVHGTEKMLRRVLGEDIRLEVRLQQDLWRVRCDPGQIEQVVLNLAVNARDAMPGGGRLLLETSNAEQEDGGGDHVRLLIRDSGAGMSEEVRSHLFEPFFTTKPVGQGTGLGLATVYGIVEQNGGRIQVESAPGRGTAFEIRLPRDLSPAAAVASPPRLGPVRGTETVVVVEDDPQVRDVTVRALRSAGYRVISAEDGHAALEAAVATSAPIHLLVTDVVLPETDGRAVADLFRARFPGLRTLFVSGYPQDVIAHHGVLDSGVDLLQKPFTPSALLARARAVLDA